MRCFFSRSCSLLLSNIRSRSIFLLRFPFFSPTMHLFYSSLFVTTNKPLLSACQVRTAEMRPEARDASFSAHDDRRLMFSSSVFSSACSLLLFYCSNLAFSIHSVFSFWPLLGGKSGKKSYGIWKKQAVSRRRHFGRSHEETYGCMKAAHGSLSYHHSPLGPWA